MAVSLIQALLNGHLATTATAMGVEVAWENQEFKPGHNDPYLRPTLMLAEPVAAGLGTSADNRQTGLFQIDVMGVANKGWSVSYGHADALGAAFKRGSKFSDTGIVLTCRKVAIGPGRTEDGRYILPATVHFQAYTSPDA